MTVCFPWCPLFAPQICPKRFPSLSVFEADVPGRFRLAWSVQTRLAS